MIFFSLMQIKLIFTRKELANDLHVLLPIPCSLAVCLYLFLSHFFFLGPFSRAVVPIWRGFVTNKYFYVRRFSSRQTKLTGGICARKWPSRGKNVRGYCYVFATAPILIVLPAIKLLLWGAHSPIPSPFYLCAVTLHYNLPILLIACKVYSGDFIQCVHEALTTLSPPLKSTISVVQYIVYSLARNI